jgi:hypothetical protein
MEADPALWSRIQNLILQSITTPAELQ